MRWQARQRLAQAPPPARRCSQELLEACGRAHSLEDVHRAIEAVQAAGFESWSLDLISGLPHLTPELWQQSLDAAVAARPPHVSVYDLQVRASGVGVGGRAGWLQQQLLLQCCWAPSGRCGLGGVAGGSSSCQRSERHLIPARHASRPAAAAAAPAAGGRGHALCALVPAGPAPAAGRQRRVADVRRRRQHAGRRGLRALRGARRAGCAPALACSRAVRPLVRAGLQPTRPACSGSWPPGRATLAPGRAATAGEKRSARPAGPLSRKVACNPEPGRALSRR
jgi:hypothetical protein